jgi:hypothetical protein
MAPLVPGVTVAVTRELYYGTLIERQLHWTRQAANNSSSSHDDQATGNNIWLFAPVLVFLLLLICILWYIF